MAQAETPGSTPDRDEQIAAARAANRFDIRRIIGALFVLYGVILTLLGILASEHVKTKAAGINIDLWTGIAMLVFGVLMVAWALLRPVEPEPEKTRGVGSGPAAATPA